MVTVPTVLYRVACAGSQEAMLGLAALHPSPGAPAESCLIPGPKRSKGLLQKLLLAPINWTILHRTDETE